MLLLLILAVEGLAYGSAIRFGDRTLRLAGIWSLGNALLETCSRATHLTSPTLHLISEGVYATGLLPLAFLSVSPWIGIIALLSCANFTLQSVYLLSDKEADWTFVAICNVSFMLTVLTMVSGTIVSFVQRQRERAHATSALAQAEPST